MSFPILYLYGTRVPQEYSGWPGVLSDFLIELIPTETLYGKLWLSPHGGAEQLPWLQGGALKHPRKKGYPKLEYLQMVCSTIFSLLEIEPKAFNLATSPVLVSLPALR